MLRYHTIPVTPFQQNCSIVWCDQTLQAAVIDPGGDLELLLAEVKRRGLALLQIWQTHAHIDHAGGTQEVLGIEASQFLWTESPTPPRLQMMP